MPYSSMFHPVHQCDDGIFNAASKKKISLDEPTPDMIDIKDIAAGLSKICRFGGQLKDDLFYTVAQHSVLVAAMVPDHLKKEALLHDAAEAYIHYIIKPWKNKLKAIYEPVEMAFDEAISAHFNIDLAGTRHLIKPYDRKALELEDLALRKDNMGPLMLELEKHNLLLPDQWVWDHKISRKLFTVAYTGYFNL